MNTQKQSLRRHVKHLLAAIPPAQRHHEAAEVCRQLLAESLVACAAKIVAFYPMADEIDIRPALSSLVAMGREVYLPVIVGDSLVFRLYTGDDCLQPEGQYGILEPQATPTLEIADGEGGAEVTVIVPGVAFTPLGGRLGRGRGFYDRALEMLNKAHTVGVAYSLQVLDSLPLESHDKLVERLLYAK